MNTTSASTYGPNPNLGSPPLGNYRDGIIVSTLPFGVLIIIVAITYPIYVCYRARGGTTTSALGSHSSADEFSIITIQQGGLDEATLTSYPQSIYSKPINPYKGDSTTSACSICLADYDDGDLLRLLPDCGHLFHLKCIDPWLMRHPTCPVCRCSPTTAPLAPPPMAAPLALVVMAAAPS